MITDFSTILQYRAKTHPRRTAFIFDDKQYSYLDYYQNAVSAADYLLSMGLKKGDRFGILDFNNDVVVNLISGAMIAGIIPVSLNWRIVPTELLFLMNDAGIEHLIYGDAFGKLVEATPFSPEIKLKKVKEFSTGNTPLTKKIITSSDPDEICSILYTSGTTGHPKGVMLTYKNIFTCYQLCAYDTPSFGPDGRNLVSGPLFSIFGFGSFFAAIYAGATNVLLPMFDAQAVCTAISTHKVTNALLVPVMFRYILALDNVQQMDFSSLRHVQYGGSPVSSFVLRKAAKLFNCYFTQVYGLTETSGVATALRYDDHEKILSEDNTDGDQLLLSAGKAGLGIQLKIIDNNGVALPAGEKGEVCIKGENIAKGYWNNTQSTGKTFREDGWFLTGDIGYLNEQGYLFLVDRKNDLIVSKGINIYPSEVENVLMYYPHFSEVAVIGIPDEKSGEAICAVAILKDEQVELKQLQEWCKDKLSHFKIPKHLEVVEQFPRGATGKVIRKIIRDGFWVNEERKIKG